MTTSIDGDEGTSNLERITAEIQKAAQEVDERFPGYRERLAQIAVDCYVLAAEHGEQRININQKYDQAITSLAQQIDQDLVNRGGS